MIRNQHIRFMNNNMAASTGSALTSSSVNSTYPLANSLLENRYKYFMTAGNFTIGSTNNKLYFNDGSPKTATISSASYTATTLAIEIQSQMNAVGSGWTVTYSTTTGLFTISHASPHTLTLSNQNDAIWDTIGFVAVVNATAPLTSDEIRCHTSEYIDIDLVTAYECTFFAAIGPIDEVFSLSSLATVTLMADNIPNNWTVPAFSRTLAVRDAGILEFLDDATDTTFRYWRIKIVDRLNPGILSAVKISHIYLGDYVTITSSNISNGFSKSYTDNAEVAVSESGVMYYSNRTKQLEISNCSIQVLSSSERQTLEQMGYDLGITGGFYLSLDPTLVTSDTLSELTRFVRFTSIPSISHVFYDKYNMGFSVREIV
jgi:hypothetical protein